MLCFKQTIAQTALQWQKSMGGRNNEYAYASTPTSDGGYIIVGSTQSNNDGDVPASKAFNGLNGADIWVVKVNTWGEMVWSKTFGGTKDDIATDVLETKDKNILILATTTSTDGDGLGNGTRGGLILLKLKTDGTVLWRKVFAGGYNVGDIAFTKADAYSKPSIKTTADGNYIISANILPLIKTDLWLAKITENAEVLWAKTYGTSQNDWVNEVIVCADGGYLMVGGTEGSNSEVPGAGKGYIDVYLIKTNATGTPEWQKGLGGSNLDEAFSGIQLAGGSFLIVGESNSTNGDFAENLGEKDGFVVNLSTNGTLLWKKQVGGTYADGLYVIRQSANGKIYAFGQSNSTIGTIKPKGSVGDVWITHIDETNGNLKENLLLGGADIEIARGAYATSDGEFIVAANANSVDGDLTHNNGNTDFWLIKTGAPLPVTLSSFSAALTNEQYVKLSWTSLNEAKAKNFVIERSFDLIRFTAIGQVNATGTTTTAKSYTLTDTKPVLGKNYYRLKFYDNINKEFIYKTVLATVSLLSTETEITELLTVYPNPVTGSSFYVKSSEKLNAVPYLLDASGKSLPIEISSSDASHRLISVNHTLKPGLYFLVWDSAGNKIVKKLIVL
ncbi:T9SS type A sorting domain-containing protein [Emticicia agri]|uniref:T9SS type A sorting domain-containing protein n=1 Tax=Emticicia agri TaxID=2492393 RepID=UPI001A915801|nr:T9SS type A sorting domain-containing protein [Emticicia agri]